MLYGPRCRFLNLISAIWLLFISSAAAVSPVNQVLVQGAAVQSLVYPVHSGGLSTHP